LLLRGYEETTKVLWVPEAISILDWDCIFSLFDGLPTFRKLLVILRRLKFGFEEEFSPKEEGSHYNSYL